MQKQPSFHAPNFGRRFGKIAPWALLAMGVAAPVMVLLAPSVARAQSSAGLAENGPDPVAGQEATPPPDGQYVFDGSDFVASLDARAEEYPPSASAGSLSGQAADKFDAGVLGEIWHDASRSDSVTTTYRWHWESRSGLAPAPYKPFYTFTYSGTATGSPSGGATQTVSGSGGASTGGTGSLGGGNQSFSASGAERPGTRLVSLSQTLSLSSALALRASNGAVDAKLNQSVSGRISIP